MLKEISVGLVVIGVLIAGLGYKSKKAISVGSLAFFLGLLGIFFFS